MEFLCYAITRDNKCFIPMDSIEDAKGSLILFNDDSDPDFTGSYRLVKIFESGKDELEFEETSEGE